MNTEQTRQALRISAFDREFGKITQRETWLTMYLALRDGGDSHSTATETIRGERQMLSRICSQDDAAERRPQ